VPTTSTTGTATTHRDALTFRLLLLLQLCCRNQIVHLLFQLRRGFLGAKEIVRPPLPLLVAPTLINASTICGTCLWAVDSTTGLPPTQRGRNSSMVPCIPSPTSTSGRRRWRRCQRSSSSRSCPTCLTFPASRAALPSTRSGSAWPRARSSGSKSTSARWVPPSLLFLLRLIIVTITATPRACLRSPVREDSKRSAGGVDRSPQSGTRGALPQGLHPSH